jgi:hypothetical protein
MNPKLNNCAAVVTLVVSAIGTSVTAQTYGTRQAGQGPSNAPGTYSTSAPCAACGWVESVTWIERLDPALVAAAGGGQSGQGNQALALALSQSQTEMARSHYEIRIRMDDGSFRVLRQDEPLPLGMAVHWTNGRVSPR